MNELLEKAYAEKVPASEVNTGRAWYIPHHGVYNSQKRKLRVVFDCSSRYMGTYLNDVLFKVY